MSPFGKFIVNVACALALVGMIAAFGFVMSIPDIVRNKQVAERYERADCQWRDGDYNDNGKIIGDGQWRETCK